MRCISNRDPICPEKQLKDNYKLKLEYGPYDETVFFFFINIFFRQKLVSQRPLLCRALKAAVAEEAATLLYQVNVIGGLQSPTRLLRRNYLYKTESRNRREHHGVNDDRDSPLSRE